jgi:hypothetical protein
MGVRVITSAGNFSPAVPTFKGSLGVWQGSPHGRLQGRRFSTPRMTLLFDGTTGKDGLAAALPANEAWVDPMSMLKFGLTQYSLTGNYVGAGTCTVYGAMLPPDYSVKVEDATNGPGLVTEASSLWQQITILNPNVAFNLFDTTKVRTFTLYRFVFATATQPGSVVVTAL